MFLRLPASRQLGARVDGMVNTHELPINVVRTNKPKMLTGLSQKARGLVWEFSLLPSQTRRPPADRQDLPHHMVRTRNVVSPSSSHQGRQAVRHSRWGGGYRRMEEAKATR
jgi:hypothetical protein